MWSFLIVLIAIAALWFGLRRTSVGPKLILVLAVPVLVVLLILYLTERRAPEPGIPDTGGSWLEPSARHSINLSGDLKTLDGRTVALKDFKGKVVFVNFWATWCGPCMLEMPSIVSLHERFSKQGLRIVAISDEDLQTVRAHVQRKGYPFTVLVDPEDALATRLGVQGIPTTFILDQEGRLIYHEVGASNWDSAEVRQKIEALLTQ